MTGFANLSPRDGEIYNEGFEEGRAESEAQIAALKSQLNESEMHRHELMERLQDRCNEITALQSERNALREALVRLQYDFAGASSSTVAIMEAEDIRKYMRFRLHEILSTSASGEPARKP